MAQTKAKKAKVKAEAANKVKETVEEQDFLSAAEVLKQVAKVVTPAPPSLDDLPEIDMKFDSNLE
jgi:hypothetical protein